MRLLLIALGAAVVAYLGSALLTFLYQGRLVFPVPGARVEPQAPGAARVELAGGDWKSVALHFPAPAGAPTLVDFHGNAEQLADRVALLERLHGLGLGVLGVEYPGYGVASGEPSQRAILEAGEAALAHLRGLGVGPEQTVLLGQSLGSGAAVELAARGRAARLVLLTPYTSMVEMGRRLAPYLPVGLLLRHPFDSLSRAPRIAVPVLVVHGTADEVVPVEMGRRLAGAFPEARLELVEGAGHDVFAGRAGPLVGLVARFALGEAAAAEGGTPPSR